MALISCSECGKEISDKATACPHCGAPNINAPTTQPSHADSVPEPKKGGVLKWILGIPVGLLVVMLTIGSIVGNTPEGKERSRERDKIAACWELQAKKSFDPSTARIAAGLCERLEGEFRRKHGMNP